LGDLRARLGKFSEAFKVNIGSVQTGDIQRWFDGMKASPRTVKNYRTVVGTLFSFAEARGYILKGSNPVEGTERVEANGGSVEILTPDEVAKLIAAADKDFVPCLAIGAFAGLRSAEIERLDWSDVDLTGGHIIVAAAKSKTASRRIVPVADNLKQWLAPYARKAGPIWTGTHDEFYDAQQAAAAAANVEWKANGLRHSFASYRLAEVQSAAQVALEAGNSPAVVFRHYRELVKPSDAVKWFAVSPKTPANVVNISTATG
jgi:integrase